MRAVLAPTHAECRSLALEASIGLHEMKPKRRELGPNATAKDRADRIRATTRDRGKLETLLWAHEVLTRVDDDPEALEHAKRIRKFLRAEWQLDDRDVPRDPGKQRELVLELVP